MRNRTILRTLILTAASMACLAIAATLNAQNVFPPPQGAMSTVGVVTGLARFTPHKDATPVLRIGILQDSGQPMTIQACDRIANDPRGLAFAVGDRILASGTMTQKDGVPILESCDIRLLSVLADSNEPAAPAVTYEPTVPETNTDRKSVV